MHAKPQTMFEGAIGQEVAGFCPLLAATGVVKSPFCIGIAARLDYSRTAQMKLRIHDNRLRLRLTRSEVSALGYGTPIRNSIRFSATASLEYSVEATSQVQKVAATFEDGKIVRVTIPLATARQWANSDQVGIEAAQIIDGDCSLSIVVEKDFQCLHSPGKGEDDSFPNPRNQ
jgi:hypothetical protein